MSPVRPTRCAAEKWLLTSVKKLSIALVILIPEDLLCGSRASGRSNSCVDSATPRRRRRKQIREFQSMVSLLDVCGMEDGEPVGVELQWQMYSLSHVLQLHQRHREFFAENFRVFPSRSPDSALCASAAPPCVASALGSARFGRRSSVQRKRTDERPVKTSGTLTQSVTHSDPVDNNPEAPPPHPQHPPPPPPPAAPLSLSLLLPTRRARSWAKAEAAFAGKKPGRMDEGSGTLDLESDQRETALSGASGQEFILGRRK